MMILAYGDALACFVNDFTFDVLSTSDLKEHRNKKDK
jgi:hypothetical protein